MPRFVGRRDELAALTAPLLAGRRERMPAATVVMGEPGAGKSRLLDEILDAFGGPRAIRLVGFEPSRNIPLAAAAPLVRELGRDPRHGPGLERLAFEDVDAATVHPLRIFEAAHRALGSTGSLLVAIDDLQWVDSQSLALVQYLLRSAEPGRIPLSVVVAARVSPEVAALAAAIDRTLPEARRTAIHLGPLPLADAIALVAELDPSLSDDAARRLWERARGVPFWLEALALGGRADAIPDLIAHRLGGVGHDAGLLLAALAVGGRPFGERDLSAVLGWDIERTTYAARELVAAGLVVQAGPTLAVAHDLIREGATESVPRSLRRHLHARFADLLADAGDDPPDLVEALQHRRAAGLPAAGLVARIAGSPKRRLLAPDGLRLLVDVSDDLDPASAEARSLDRGIGALAAELGEQELAEGRWARAARHEPDPDLRQEAAIEAALAAYRRRRSADAEAYLRQADQAGSASPIARVRIAALQAEIQLWLTHSTARAAEAARTALELADRVVEDAVAVEALAPPALRACLAALQAATDAALQQDRAHDVLELSRRTLALADRLDEEAAIAALLRTGFALRPVGRVRESKELFARAWEAARRQVLPIVAIEAGHGLARALRDLGQLHEARAVAGEAAEIELRVGTVPRRWGQSAAVLHSIDLVLGDPGTALKGLRAELRNEGDPHFRIAMHETIATWEARIRGPRARDVVMEELEAGRADVAVAGCRRCANELEVHAAEALARVGQPSEARRVLAAWESRRGQRYEMSEVWRLRAAASVAAAAADGAAVPILEELVKRTSSAGFVEDLLWARLDLGRELARVDRDRAIATLAAAAAEAEAVGAVTHRRLAARALRELGIRTWRRGRTGSGDQLDRLSEREREVVEHVAAGRSNREIADALVVSPKTVERHITNILAKLDLRNRTELAAMAGPRRGTGFSR